MMRRKFRERVSKQNVFEVSSPSGDCGCCKWNGGSDCSRRSLQQSYRRAANGTSGIGTAERRGDAPSRDDRWHNVRFRQGQGNAVLDLHKARVPTLRTVHELTLKGAAMPLGNDGFTVSSHAEPDSQLARDYQVQVVNTANSQELNRVLNVKGIREEITKYDTGTTFLLTDGGLALIRRPVKEMSKQLHDSDYAN
jgi:hypothetical protein